MLCWILVTVNKVSAGVESSRGGKDQANFKKAQGLLKSRCQKYHLSVPPSVSGAVISCRCHKTILYCLERAMLLFCSTITVMACAETQ